MDWEDVKFCAFVVLIFAVAIVGLVAGITYFNAATYNGQRYEVTVTVQAVEHSTRWGEHTNVWVRVYGDQNLTYKFIGTINLEVGKTYKIVFVDQMWMEYYIAFTIRGNVVSVEEV
jgi:desulfoferrodoxin (superoxide reductase-like protein)